MHDSDVKVIMDRAAGMGELPVGLVDRVISGARTRRRRRIAGASGTLAVLGVAGFLWLPLGGGGEQEPPTQSVLAQDLDQLSEAMGAPVPADRVLAAADTGAESVVALRRESAPAGEKAAEVWIARDGQPYRMVSDFLSYDSGCMDGDKVCAEVLPTGLGMYLVRQSADGRAIVLATAPDGRRVEIVTRNGPVAPVAAQRGVMTEIPAAEANEVRVRAYLPDGRSYFLPTAPGAVITS